MYNIPYQLSVNLPMCLCENQHFHELDSHGSNAVVVRVQELHDDLLHVDHEAPGRLHAVRDGLGLAQPFQRGPEKNNNTNFLFGFLTNKIRRQISHEHSAQ
jgi:hypothetical protein